MTGMNMFRSKLNSEGGQICRAASEALGLLQFTSCAAVVPNTLQQHVPSISTAGPPPHQQSRVSWWSTAAAVVAAAATAGGTAVSLADSKQPSAAHQPDAQQSDQGEGVTAGGKLLSLSMRQRIFFKYEKRIKDLSSLEKIYEYFATQTQDGRKVMSAQDVVRALVPTYPPVGSDVERAGFLDGERGHSKLIKTATDDIISFFDHNKDGAIGFDEFVLIVIALSVPEKDTEVVFDVMDLDNNGVLDEDEFMQVLQQLERRAGIQHNFAGRVGKHAVSESSERQMTHKLFAEQGGKGVSLSRFRTFLKRLQDGMLKLEFAHYDTAAKGFIKGADFANSLVTSADIKVVDSYLDKVHQLPPELAAAQITSQQFEHMVHLRRNMHVLSFALDFCAQIERPLQKEDFAKLVFKTLGVQLAPAVVDIVYAVFGDAQGRLDGPAFVAIMKSRNRVPGYRKGQGLSIDDSESDSNLPRWWNCVRNCWFGPHQAY